MKTEFIEIKEENGISRIVLNRPDKRNAMHGPMITELTAALKQLATSDTRVLLINGNGENFCAGGDIVWMQKIALTSSDKNYEDAQGLADLLYQLHIFPKPVIVLAHGATLGGGLGLLSAADIAIAADNAVFGLPEVKIGLAPSMISPYVIAAIGERQAHYYFLTGEIFGSERALGMNLIHQITKADNLLATGLKIADTLKQNSPQALRSAKKLMAHVVNKTIDESLAQQTAQHLAELRMTSEAQEGLKSFQEKRKPEWIK